MIVTLADFTGEYSIASNSITETKITAIILDREPKILASLLGNAMATELLSTILCGGSNTPTALQTYIFNPFILDLGCVDFKSEGIKIMLCKMLYFYISREGIANNSVLGNRVNNSEVSSGIDNTLLITNYNAGVDTYKVIQRYIHDNSVDYPEFRGKEIGYASIV